MSEEKNGFIGYEYHNVSVERNMELIYTDGYENFGWTREDATASLIGISTVSIKFKRDRKIRNKAELTRLQRQFDACVSEIVTLEKSKKSRASITALTIGFLGCAFLGCATFAYLAGLLPLMIILAIPGFLCWILPYFCYRHIFAKRGAQIAPLIEKNTMKFMRSAKRLTSCWADRQKGKEYES